MRNSMAWTCDGTEQEEDNCTDVEETEKQHDQRVEWKNVDEAKAKSREMWERNRCTEEEECEQYKLVEHGWKEEPI